MKLFGRQTKSKFAEFYEPMRARRLQRQVIEANSDPRRVTYEAMLGRRPIPLFQDEVRASQSFSTFRAPDDAREMGLARFFRPGRGWFKGGK